MSRMIGDAFVVIRPDTDEFRPLAETGVRTALAGIHPTVPVGLSIDRDSLGRFLSATQRAANIKVNAETGEAVKSVLDLKARLDALSKSLAEIQIKADDTKALSTVANLQLKIRALADKLTNLQITADDTAAVARITALQAQIVHLSNSLGKMEADVDIQAAVAKIAALKAELDLLVSKREEVRIGISAPALAAAEAQILGMEAAFKAFTEAETTASAATNTFNGRIGRFGLGLLTATVPLFAGATAVSGFHLALDAVVELLAVIVPAVVTAAAGLGAFAVAASDSAKQVYQMVTSIHTVGDAMNATIPPMTGKLEALHNQVRPQVWQIYGDAIDVVHTKTGLFNQLATQTGSLLDTLAAHFTVLITQSGPGLAAFLDAGKRDLAEFGRIALSLGDAFGKLIKITQETHIAEYLLDIVGAGAKLLDMITKLPIPLLAVVVGLHGLYLWGGLATTGIISLVSALARMTAGVTGLKLANTALGDLSKNGTGIERLGASATIFSQSIKGLPERVVSLAKALPGLAVNPWVLLGVGVAVLTGLTIWLIRSKDATDKWIDSSNRLVSTAPIYAAINVTAKQLTETTQRLNDVQNKWGDSLLRIGPDTAQAANDASKLAEHHQQLSDLLVQETTRIAGVAHNFGYTLPGAMALATFAGVKIQDLTSKSNTTWATAIQKIQGVVDGYKAMGQGSSQLGNDINAINVGASDQAKAIQNLNTAWDGFIKIVGAPVDTFLTFSQSLVRFGNDATVAGAKITGLGSGIEGVSRKVTNSSIQLQQDFQASFEAANQLFDAMRSAQAPADQQIKAVKDTVATLIPLAGTSKVAAAEISALAQEAGGPATTNLQTLQKWAGVTSKQGLQGLQKDTNNAAVAMSNLSQDAAKLGSTLQKDLNAEMAKAVEHAVGLQGAMDKYTKSLHDNGAASSETESDRKALVKDLTDIFHNSNQVNTTMKTLSGAFTDNGAAASATRKYRQQAVQDFQDQSDKANDAKSALEKYTQEVQNNGKDTDAAKKYRQQLITDLINSGVNSKIARQDVDNYTTSIKGNATNTDAARKARAQLIQDIFNASNNAKTGKTDIDKLTGAIEGHGIKSSQYHSARAQLIQDLKNAGLSAKDARTLVDNLSTSIAHIPKNPNVVLHMKGDGSYTITGAGPRAIPKGPAQLAPLATGGKIPGWGNHDSVPAMLTPGEVVVPKGMVSAGAVDHLRGKLPGFASGGLVATNMVPASNPNILPSAMYNSFGKDIIHSLTGAMADEINKERAAAQAATVGLGGSFGDSGARSGSAALAQAFARSLLAQFGWAQNQMAALIPLWNQECYSLDAMILTRDGWRQHDEVSVGDETIGYNPVTGRNEWTPITRVVHYEDAEVWRIGHSRWHADVTPGHRWWSDYRKNNGRGYVVERSGFTQTADLTSGDRLLLAAPADTDGIPGLSLEDVAVLAWIQGDGHIEPVMKSALTNCPECGWAPPIAAKNPGRSIALHRNHPRTKHGIKNLDTREIAGYDGRIYQSKPAQITRLRALLAHVEHTETVTDRGSGQPEHTFLLRRGYVTDLIKRSGLANNDPEAFVRRLSPDQRAAWLAAMIDAEGQIKGGHTLICQNDGPLQDAIALAVYLEGFKPSVCPVPLRGNTQPASTIGLTQPHVAVSVFQPPQILERQPVWCVTTELGSWTARQHGQVFLTGNSGWNAYAVNPSSGAYGIPQSLGHGHPYNLGDYKTQVIWGLQYIKGRYGSPAAAWGHEQAYNWYSKGGQVADQGAVLKPGWNPPLYNGTGRDEPLVPQNGGMSNQVGAAILAELRAIRQATQAAPGHYARALNGTASRAANTGYYSP